MKANLFTQRLQSPSSTNPLSHVHICMCIFLNLNLNLGGEISLPS